MAEPQAFQDICAALGEREGCVIRPWKAEDADALVAAWVDPEIARWNPVPAEPTTELAASWIAGTAKQTSLSSTVDAVLVRQDALDQLLGEVGLQIDRGQRLAEIGFWVAEPHRGSGYGQRLLDFGLSLARGLSLRGAVAMVDPENTGAQTTLRSAGWSPIPATGSRLAFAAKSQREDVDG